MAITVSDVQAVHVVDEEDGVSFGWHAMPTVPAIGDGVSLPGVERPALVVGRRWAQGEVPPAGTMTGAGLETDGTAGKWHAEVTVRLDMR